MALTKYRFAWPTAAPRGLNYQRLAAVGGHQCGRGKNWQCVRTSCSIPHEFEKIVMTLSVDRWTAALVHLRKQVVGRASTDVLGGGIYSIWD